MKDFIKKQYDMMDGEKPSNEGGGLRFNEGKTRMDLLEPYAIEELAKELDVEKEDLVMAMESNFSVEYLHGVIHEEEGSPICLIDKISQKQGDPNCSQGFVLSRNVGTSTIRFIPN